MAEHEIIDAFLQGTIGQWGVFHRLRALGVSAAAALAIAGALPNVVAAADTQKMQEIVSAFPQDDKALSRMLDHLADELLKVVDGGPERPLATTLARLAANNADLLNEQGNAGNLPLNLKGGNFELNGELRVREGNNNNNINLVLDGNFGAIPINLEGSINLPAVQRGHNIGNVNLNVDGNIGNMPINLVGNIGNGPD
jgi:hypothetical protein